MKSSDVFFDGAEFGGSGDALYKALMAGSGTDSAYFTGGRALQPEDCEASLMNVMREMQDDFKLMNSIKKTPVSSTVRQYNVRTDVGDADIGFVGEGESTPMNAQDIRRRTVEMKFIQKQGQVTQQLITAGTFVDAMAAEQVATTISTLKTAEKFCFHGDSGVVPRQFDGLLAQIRATPEKQRNIYDLRGKTIAQAGEDIFTTMTEMIYDKGGDANKVHYPLILAQEIQGMVRDRLRFGTADTIAAVVVDKYPTVFGSLEIAGAAAGPNKLFMPKGRIKSGGVKGLPDRPASVSCSIVSSSIGFTGSEAGVYRYQVHAVKGCCKLWL